MAKTESGFTYTVNPKVKDDWGLLKLLRDYEKNPLLIIDIAVKLIGNDGLAKLEEHCTVDGIVSAEKMIKEILEISNKDNDTKK